MSWAASQCLHTRTTRPGGSHDFETVLGEFVHDASDKTPCVTLQLVSSECQTNGGDIQSLITNRDLNEGIKPQEIQTSDSVNQPGVSSSDKLEDCTRESSELCEENVKKKKRLLPRILKSSIIRSGKVGQSTDSLQTESNMGNNCGSKFQPYNEWHSVTESEWMKSSRRDKLLKGRTDLKDGIKNLSLTDMDQCTCTHVSVAWPEKLGSPRSSSRSLDNYPATLRASRRPPSDLPIFHSPQNSRKSQVAKISCGRATSNCDVSPHRLTQRSLPHGQRSRHSPHLTFSSHPSHPLYKHNKQQNDSRNRSQSWSSGRHGTKSGFLSGKSEKKSTLSHNTQSNLSLDEHDPSCPLYHSVTLKDKRKSFILPLLEGRGPKSQGQDDMLPMPRRRAASESQKQRPRRLPATPEETGHSHVHWADEATGHALSTSVLLSSIRPRSYSHGANDNTRQRPILKKNSENNISS